MIYTFYDPITGKIKFTYSGIEIEAMAALHDTLLYVSGDYTENSYYILNGEVLLRQNQSILLDKTTIIADGIDTVTISNMASGIISISNGVDHVTGEVTGTETFSTNIVGTYYINISSFPYLLFKTSIEAI